MSTSFGLVSLLPMLIALPALIGQWIGILGLGKCKRGSEWWCMLVGISLTTLGSLFAMALPLILTFGTSSASFGGLSFLPFYYATGGFTAFGAIVFAVGFAIHGQRSSKHVQRIRELESIAQDQNEELASYRAV